MPRALTFKILRSTCTIYLCVSYGTQNKQRLFPCVSLTVTQKEYVYCKVRPEFLNIVLLRV